MKKYYHEALKDQGDGMPFDKDYIELPQHKIVCPRCGGEGHHFRSDLDENYLIDSFREDNDLDGYESYRSGAFDQICSCCNGKNVIDSWDWDYAYEHYPEQMKEIDFWNECEAAYARESAAERMMGA